MEKTRNKTCATCMDNDDGLCDRKGILVQDDDTCEKWRDENNIGCHRTYGRPGGQGITGMHKIPGYAGIHKNL